MSNKLYEFPRQTVVLKDFAADGYILDIGGGGEGVIGRLKPGKVIAIDSNKKELENAPRGPLKIIMDARDLQFLDSSFSCVTAFYSLMFMSTDDHRQVFQEVYRVLESDGSFRVWDTDVNPGESAGHEGFLTYVDVELPEITIRTGYGSNWPEIEYCLDYYVKLARQTGFEVVESHSIERAIFLLLSK